MNKISVSIKILISLMVSVFSTHKAFADWPGQMPMVQGYMGTDMGWMMLLFWGLILGILVLVIHWVLNLPQKDNQFSEKQRTAVEILNDRFAKGEIDIKEFELKKQIITG